MKLKDLWMVMGDGRSGAGVMLSGSKGEDDRLLEG